MNIRHTPTGTTFCLSNRLSSHWYKRGQRLWWSWDIQIGSWGTYIHKDYIFGLVTPLFDILWRVK